MILRVVIFDNNTDALDALNYLLSSLGHEVLCFSEPYICPIYTDNSCECLQTDACVDLLLMDNKMSRMSGLEFIRQQSIRGCKGMVKNKAVLSVDWSPEEIDTARQLGCKIFAKPLDLQELFTWLNEQHKKLNPARTLTPLSF